MLKVFLFESHKQLFYSSAVEGKYSTHKLHANEMHYIFTFYYLICALLKNAQWR
jgi:hypothetical protein